MHTHCVGFVESPGSIMAELAHEQLRRQALERIREKPSLVLVDVNTGAIVQASQPRSPIGFQ